MRAKKGVKSISKGSISAACAEATGLKQSDCSKILSELAELGAKEVKKTGKFTIPGLCMIKTRLKKATKAGKREMFGQVVKVKAMKARTVVKAYAVAAVKRQFGGPAMKGKKK